MNIIPWGERRHSLQQSPFELLRKEMDSLFEKVLTPSTLAENGWSPSVDVSETDKSVEVRIEVPGVDPKNVELSLEGSYLTIRGEKKDEREEKNQNYHRIERSFGSFLRTIELPSNIDSENVHAEHKNGLLTVTIGKQKGTEPKKISVRTN